MLDYLFLHALLTSNIHRPTTPLPMCNCDSSSLVLIFLVSSRALCEQKRPKVERDDQSTLSTPFPQEGEEAILGYSQV